MTATSELPFPDVELRAVRPFPAGGVVISERGCELELHFDRRTGDASLLELRLRPVKGNRLEPAKAREFVPQLDLYLALARAAMDWELNDARGAAEALRAVGRPGRGLSDDFYRLIAMRYKSLVREGERHPVKALGKFHWVTISTASRWVTEARRRGYLPEKNPAPGRKR